MYVLDIWSWYGFLIFVFWYIFWICGFDICYTAILIYVLDIWSQRIWSLDICSWFVFAIYVPDIYSWYLVIVLDIWGRTNLISSIKEGVESLSDILRKKGDVERRSGDGESYPVGRKYMLYVGRGTQGSYSRCRYIVLDIVLDICYNYWYIFLIYVLDMFLAGICSWYMGWIYVLDIRYKWTYVDSICSGYMFLLHVSDTCFLHMNALDIYCWYIYVRERQVEHGMPFRRC